MRVCIQPIEPYSQSEQSGKSVPVTRGSLPSRGKAQGHECGVQHLTVTGVRKWAPGTYCTETTYDVRYRIPVPHARATRPRHNGQLTPKLPRLYGPRGLASAQLVATQ